MNLRRIEIFVITVCLLVTVVETIPFILNFRLLGQNLLNARLWQYLTVAVILLGNSKVFSRKSLMALYLCAAIYFLFAIIGHYDLQSGRVSRFAWLHAQHFSLGFCILLREHYAGKERVYEAKKIINYIFIFYLIAFALNIYVIIRNPSAVRGIDFRISGQGERFYRSMGLAGYGFVSSVPYLIPIAVFKFKQSRSVKPKRITLFWFIFIAMAIVSSYLSTIVAPFILSVILLIISILGRTRVKHNSLIIVVLVLAFIVIPKHYTADMVRRLASLTPNRELSVKLYDLANTVEGGLEIVDESEAEGQIEGRTARVRVNLKRFSESPIIGKGTSSSGEHMYWLHILAQFGLIGAVSFLMIFFLAWKKDFAIKVKEYQFFHFLSILGFIMLGFMKAVTGIHMFLVPFFIAPMIAYLEHNAVLNTKT